MTIDATTLTVLVLEGMGIPQYSTRGASQKLTPIAQASANIYRDVNGDLQAAGGTQFRKYASQISCTDQRPLSSNGVWPGQLVTVSCIQELSYPTATGSPERDVVAGSSYVEGAFTFYRPQLDMMVLGYELTTDEYGAIVGWTLDLEEC